MMCPVTIPGSEQDWQSKNAIKKSIQIHFVYLKSGAMSFFFFSPSAPVSLCLYDTEYLYETLKKQITQISRFILHLVGKTG